MRRRAFITLLGGAAAAWPLAARAQQAERMRRIGVLMNLAADDAEGQARIAAFRPGAAAIGLDRRPQRADRLSAGQRAMPIAFTDMPRSFWRSRRTSFWPRPPQAFKHCSRRPAPCPSCSRTSATRSPWAWSRAWRARAGTPPVLPLMEFGFGAKWLELLKEIAPRVTRVAVLRDLTIGPAQLSAIQAVAPSFGVELSAVGVRDAGEIERSVAAFARSSNGGMIVTASTSALVHRDLITMLAARHRLPAVYAFRYMVTAGGLISYGPDPIDMYRRAAGYVDRILKGEKPADLPVQAPTKYELVINLKTAKALGLEMPTTVLARADEVIE